MKRFLSLMVLVGFIGGAILSFSAMNHNKDGVMSGACPIASLHGSTCSTDDTLAMVTHYISMYQAFTSSLVFSIMTQVLAISLLFVLMAYGLRKYLIQAPYLFRLSRSFGAKLYRPQALTRWLSLLVNSPSFS